MVQTVKSKETLEFQNFTIDKKKLSRLVLEIYEKYGSAIASDVADSLKALGFHYATKAGVTISIEDLTVPEAKKDLISSAEKQIEDAQKKFERGDITEVERYNKVIDTWSETTEKLTEKVVERFDRLNPVYMMAFSGARGNLSQVRQLVGMRGLMADSQGQIIDLPIKANFKEGLNVTEYIISSYGARKGLVDTALKTADSGYLTRRLVDVAQDVTVRSHDCGSKRGVVVHALFEGEKLTVGIVDRVIGRVAVEDILSLKTKEVIVKSNELIDRKKSKLIEEHGVASAKVRSPLVCDLPYGICQTCYGWSLTTNTLVDIGEAIGIIAAQSIGEPGTQLTMRTFHTGGVVAGGAKRTQIKSPVTDVLKFDIPVKEIRTRYGDTVLQTTKEGKIKIGKDDFFLPIASQIRFKSGAKVEKDAVIAEYTEVQQKGLIERATKDIISDHSGQILFEGFSVDEKRDRQGNISKTANKNGIIWVMEGDVYNLPVGSKLIPQDAQHVKISDVLAETLIISERGGEVRFNNDLVIEEVKVGKEKIRRLIQGREVSIVIARVGAENAKLEATKQGNSWKVKATKTNPEETYTIKVVPGETIENKSVIAELVDDGVLAVTTAGEIRYDGLEVDESRIITQPGKIIFIPEEVHYLSKDVSLKLVENEDCVKAGQEIVKDVFTHLDGIIEIKIDNDIIHEVIVRPGELFDIPEPTQLQCEDGEIVKEGAEIYPGIKANDTKVVSIMENEEKGTVKLLLRPVQTFAIEPKKVFIQGYSTDSNIALLAVTQMLYRDGERVRNFNGGPLSKTSLVLTMGGDLSALKGKVEVGQADVKQELQIIVQENIVLRREQDTNVTQLLIHDHDHIAPGVALAKTQVLARSTGEVSLSTQQEKRLLLITSNDLIKQETTAKPSVKVSDFVKMGDRIVGDTESACSGQVVSIEQKSVIIRKGRPYLVNTGAQLQCDQGHLVQRGDQLAALIYERVKTADIVQGLPRVEELLEGRKPKDAAILSEFNAKVKIIEEDDARRLILVSGEMEHEVAILSGLNVIVENGQTVKVGEPLTDGPANPHDILNLLGVEAVQQYLLDEVQKVYRSQGVEIADKHVETIIRQMTRKVRIEDAGDTILLPGELVEFKDIKKETDKARKLISKDARPPAYKPMLLGITKASLNTESFISAASFQETTRILSEAAIQGKKDWLRGLKENVIIGRLIPAGTGYLYSRALESNIPDYGQLTSEGFAVEPSLN